jgi:hypothetical protein
VTNAIPQTITVTPIAPTIPAGVGQRFTATATFSDSTTQDISQSATWSSTNTGVATINNFGISFGIAPGTSNIQATFGGVTGSALLTVDTGTLTSITITPSQTVLAPASTLAYTAVGHYSDGTTQFISNSASWTSTNPSVVSITTNGGVATGQSAGTANITATYQSITSNTAGVVVTSSPLASIAVTPTVAKVPVGVSIPFAATGTFQNGTTQNLTNNATWASSQPAVATINNSTGQPGFATGVSPGQTSITAVFASVVSSPATLTVSNATVRSIAVTPTNPIVTHGAQVAFKAVATFSDGSTIDLSTQVTWTSSNVAVATINNIGQANTASPGPTIITATFDGVSGMTGLTVN